MPDDLSWLPDAIAHEEEHERDGSTCLPIPIPTELEPYTYRPEWMFLNLMPIAIATYRKRRRR